MKIKPNFFIIGAPRSGTTSLYEYLKQVPEIYLSPIKEPYYFCRILVPDDHFLKPLRDETKYFQLFDNVKNEKIVGEGTTHYLADPEAARLIHEISPNAKILISLRDPIERTFSHYLLRRTANYTSSTFHELVKRELNEGVEKIDPDFMIKYGLYSENVKKFKKIFGSKNVKIIIFEEWKSDIENTIKNILDFLNVKYVADELDTKRHNEFIGKKIPRGKISKNILKNKSAISIAKKIIPKFGRMYLDDKILTKEETKPIMQTDSRNALINFYKNDVKELEQFLGRKLPWKNFN